jgi:hypothetical protein
MSNEALKKETKMKRYFIIAHYFCNKDYSFALKKDAEKCLAEKGNGYGELLRLDADLSVIFSSQYGTGGIRFFGGPKEKSQIRDCIFNDLNAKGLSEKEMKKRFALAWKKFREEGEGTFDYENEETATIFWRKK